MGKMRCFHWFFAIFALFGFTTNLFAAGYFCPDERVYTNCAEGYYLSDCGTNFTGDTVNSPTSGNECKKCDKSYTCAGGAVCPDKTMVNISYEGNGAANNSIFEPTQCFYPAKTCQLSPGDRLFRPGYAFAGWAETSDATTGIKTIDYPHKDITMYAVWSRCKNNTFNPVGTTSSTCMECPPNSSQDALGATECTCYNGWHTADGGTTTSGKACNLFSLPLDPNGGTGGTTSIDVYNCSYADENPITIPQKDGHVFVKYESSGAVAVMELVPDTIYGPNEYLFKSQVNNETAGLCLEDLETPVEPLLWDDYFFMYPFKAVWKKCDDCVAGTGVASCTTTVENNLCKVNANCMDGYAAPKCDSESFCTCTPNEYKITYNCGDEVGGVTPDTQKVTYRQNFEPAANSCENPGYSFAGWGLKNGLLWTPGEAVEYVFLTDKELVAQWEPMEYTITYNYGDKVDCKAPENQTVTYRHEFEATDFTSCENPGYKFSGWVDPISGTEFHPNKGYIYEYDRNMNLIASWTPNEYTVTYSCDDDGDGIPSKSQTVTYQSGFDTAEFIVCDNPGYTFRVWLDPISGTDFHPNKNYTYKDARDMNLVAQWEPNMYKITLRHSDDDTSDTDVIYLKYNTNWTSDYAGADLITHVAVPDAPLGKHFAGYQDTRGRLIIDANGKLVGDTTLFTNNETLTAIWSTNDSVTCPAGQYYGGTGTTCTTCPDKSYCPGVTAIQDTGTVSGLNTCPAESHSSVGASACTCNEGYTTDGTTSGDTTTTTTACQAVSYTIIFNKAGGTGGTDRITVKTAVEIPAFTYPSMTGYTFDKYRSDNGSGKWIELYYDNDYEQFVQNTWDTGDWIFWLPSDARITVSELDTWFAKYPFVAQYTPNEYTVTYACDVGDAVTKTATYDAEYEMADDSTCEIPYALNGGIWGWKTTANECWETGESFDWTYDTNFTLTPVYYHVPEHCVGGQYLGEGECGQDYCTQCPEDVNGGQIGSDVHDDDDSVMGCYATYINETILHGTQTRVCHYDKNKKSYSRECTVTVTGCDGGYYADGEQCVPVGNDWFSDNGETARTPCPENGKTDITTASTDTQCYQVCNVQIDNGVATPVAPHVNYTGSKYPECTYTATCESGFESKTTQPTANPQCIEMCPADHYCPTLGGDAIQCPPSHPHSNTGSTKQEQCWGECEQYPLSGGMAVPVQDKVQYPDQCTFHGITIDGKPCDISGDKCIVSACLPHMELINGQCQPCNRDHAVTYKDHGNCLVATCDLHYHADGTECASDTKSCGAANAIEAFQYWNTQKGAFGECIITECDSGFHVAGNTCVPDEQPCVVAHGLGTQEWNHTTNKWGKCIATSCDPGYSNDPSETNEGWEQCGRCSNMFRDNGTEIVVSSYATGCEIATCMYDGELYTLDGNECVPICNDFTDETGTRKRVGNKCVTTCVPGYIPW